MLNVLAVRGFNGTHVLNPAVNKNLIIFACKQTQLLPNSYFPSTSSQRNFSLPADEVSDEPAKNLRKFQYSWAIKHESILELFNSSENCETFNFILFKLFTAGNFENLFPKCMNFSAAAVSDAKLFTSFSSVNKIVDASR